MAEEVGMSTLWTKKEEREDVCHVCLEMTDVALMSCGHWACECCRYVVLEDGEPPLDFCDQCGPEDDVSSASGGLPYAGGQAEG